MEHTNITMFCLELCKNTISSEFDRPKPPCSQIVYIKEVLLYVKYFFLGGQDLMVGVEPHTSSYLSLRMYIFYQVLWRSANALV